MSCGCERRVPYATLVLEGTVDRLREPQNPLLLSAGEWLLVVHSVWLREVHGPVDGVAEVRCNLVRPNQTLARSVCHHRGVREDARGNLPTLQTFRVSVPDSGGTDLVHRRFGDCTAFRVNACLPSVEFELLLDGGRTAWPATREGKPVPAGVHFSFCRVPTLASLSERAHHVVV